MDLSWILAAYRGNVGAHIRAFSYLHGGLAVPSCGHTGQLCAGGGSCPNRSTLNDLGEKKLVRRFLAPHCDGLNLEVPAAQERSRANEFARRQILRGEVAPVGGIKLVVER